MKNEKFQKILEERLLKTKKILNEKAKEYVHNNDRLYNFRVGSKINNESMAQSLWGMATKHLISVKDMVSYNNDYNHDYIDEKIGDLINYLILLECILKESNEKEKQALEKEVEKTNKESVFNEVPKCLNTNEKLSMLQVF